MLAGAVAPCTSCWVVALGYMEDAPRVTSHRYANDTLADGAGLVVTYQGYRICLERPPGLGRSVVFKSFPSLREAFAFAADVGAEPRVVLINPPA